MDVGKAIFFTPRIGKVGEILGRNFYAQRHLPGMQLELPFASAPFVCLINFASHVGDDAITALATELLNHNMRYVFCAGVEAERAAGIIDEILESGDYHDNGRTAACSAHEDESLEDVLSLFALPDDLAETYLFLTVGNEAVFNASLASFNSVVDKMKSEYAR